MSTKSNEAEVKEAEVKETTTITTTKSKTWWNRIWSAIVGAVVAVAAMFGITVDQVNDEKERIVQIYGQASEALTAIKNKDLDTAKEKIGNVIDTTKEVVNNTKEAVESVKEQLKDTEKGEITKTAVGGAVDAIVKDTETK